MDTVAQDFFVIDPALMEEKEKREIAWRIYTEAHIQIFEGPGFEKFYTTLFDPTAHSHKIMALLHNTRIIGYVTFHVYALNIERQKTFIIACEMGIKAFERDFAGRLISNHLLNEVAKLVINHPLAKIYIVESFISPYPYRRACKAIHELYPKANQQLPANLARMVASVAARFHWETEMKENSIVRHHVKWKLKPQYARQRSDTLKGDENVNYFRHLITDGNRDDGVIVIVPVTFINLLLTTLNVLTLFLNYKWQKSLRNFNLVSSAKRA